MTKGKNVCGVLKSDRRTGGKKTRLLRAVPALVLCAFALTLLWAGTASAKYDFYFPAFFEPWKDKVVLDDNEALSAGISGVQQTKGPLLEGVALGGQTAGDDETALNFYVTEYRIVSGDQWEGYLSRWQGAKTNPDLDEENPFGKVEDTEKKWELGSKILSKGNARNLKYWAGGDPANFQTVLYTGSGATAADKKVRHPMLTGNALNFTPVSSADVNNTAVQANADVMNKMMDTVYVTGTTFKDKMHPSRAFVDWYYGDDISYYNIGAATDKYALRKNMLSDPGNSGVSILAPVAPLDEEPFPGWNPPYQSLVDKLNGISPKLFLQTNEGLLHVVDAANGNEDMAILPPPSLLPHRGWSLKNIRYDLPAEWRFPAGTVIALVWNENNKPITMKTGTNEPIISGSTKSCGWEVGGMTLDEAVELMNSGGGATADPKLWGASKKDNPPSGSSEIKFNITYMGNNKAAIGLVNSACYAIVATYLPPGVYSEMINMPNVLPNTTGTGSGRFDYAMQDTYRWIDDAPDFAAAGLISVPLLTLDGPLQLRYFNFTTGGWKAFLMGSLGRGGGGLYAMDVTAPATPQFLWYFETLEGVDRKPLKGRIFYQKSGAGAAVATSARDFNYDAAYWNSVLVGSGDVNPFPYGQLGFNIPKPGFGVAKQSGFVYPYRNVIVVPAGMHNTLDINNSGKMGAAVYLIDPESPETPTVVNSGSYTGVETKWKMGSAYSGGNYSTPHMSMMISEPLFVSLSAATGNYASDGILEADSRGNIHHISLKADDWGSVKTVGTIRPEARVNPDTATTESTDSYANPYGVCIGRSKSKAVWVGGGTADVGGWKNPMVFDNDDYKNKKLNEDLTIHNAGQMLFAFEFPSLGGDAGTSRRANWDDITNGGTATQKGWFLKLREAGGDYGAEYATVRPVMYGGIMYAATFRQKTSSAKFDGESRLYAVNIESGAPVRWSSDQKYLDFEGIKINGFTISKVGTVDTLVISYNAGASGESTRGNIGESKGEDGLTDVGGDLGNNNMQMDLRTILDDDDPPVASKVTNNDAVINYWRYVE